MNRAPLLQQGFGESGRPHPQVKERITIKIKRAYEPLARGATPRNLGHSERVVTYKA